ncbi:MAG: hypothetical protein EHM72_01385, partial [Calditrichaeota bacterium]
MTDPVTADSVSDRLSAKKATYAGCCFELSGSDSLPGKSVKFDDPHDPMIHRALYITEPLEKGQIIGPIRRIMAGKTIKFTNETMADSSFGLYKKSEYLQQQSI